MKLGIKIKRLEFGILIGYWELGLRIKIVFGDLDTRFSLGIEIGRDCNCGIMIRDWNWI